MSSGRSLPQFNLGAQGGIQRDSHSFLCTRLYQRLHESGSFIVGTHERDRIVRTLNNERNMLDPLQDNM
ncbi:hypothetical protein TNCV_3829821 [Trichonephila clavipes]|nr:hypothetical protein TNCV_3829821 [Trichonephila clavipes]